MSEHKPVPFKKILDKDEYSDSDNVKCIQGTITALYKVRSGEGQSGHYEFQNADMKDAAGDTIKVCFSNQTQPESAKGKLVTISSYKHDTHGWLGIKVVDEEFTAKSGPKKDQLIKQRTLKFSSTAKIEYEGGAPTAGQSAGNSGNADCKPMQLPNNVHPTKALSDMILLHAKITDLVNETYDAKDDAFKQGSTNTLFIESCRQGLQFDFGARVSKPPTKTYPPAPKDPTKWKECVLSAGSNEGKTLGEISNEDIKKLFDYYDAKGSNTDLAECVYQAARDLELIPKTTPVEDEIPMGNNDEPIDIPF